MACAKGSLFFLHSNFSLSIADNATINIGESTFNAKIVDTTLVLVTETTASNAEQARHDTSLSLNQELETLRAEITKHQQERQRLIQLMLQSQANVELHAPNLIESISAQEIAVRQVARIEEKTNLQLLISEHTSTTRIEIAQGVSVVPPILVSLLISSYLQCNGVLGCNLHQSDAATSKEKKAEERKDQDFGCEWRMLWQPNDAPCSKALVVNTTMTKYEKRTYPFQPQRAKVFGNTVVHSIPVQNPVAVAVDFKFIYVLLKHSLLVELKQSVLNADVAGVFDDVVIPSHSGVQLTLGDYKGGRFANAISVAVSDTHIFVLDGGTRCDNNTAECLHVFLKNGAKYFLSFSKDKDGTKLFNKPTSVATTSDQDFFIIDSNSSRIQVFSNTFELKGSWASRMDEFFACMTVDGDKLLVVVVAFRNYLCAIDIKTGERKKMWYLNDVGHSDEKLNIAVDADNVYITAPYAYAVHVYSKEEEIVTHELEDFDRHAGGIACDLTYLYVAEPKSNRICVFA